MNSDTRQAALAITGACGIRQAAETHAALLAAAREPDDLVVDCTGMTETDLSFIQLIIACGKSMQAQGRRFAVLPDGAGVLAGAFARAGLSPDGSRP